MSLYVMRREPMTLETASSQHAPVNLAVPLETGPQATHKLASRLQEKLVFSLQARLNRRAWLLQDWLRTWTSCP